MKNSFIQTYHLYSTSLLNLEIGETFVNQTSLPVIYNDLVYFPFLSEYKPENTLSSNYSLEDLEMLKFNPINLETLEDYSTNNNILFLYITMVIVAYLILSHMYHLCKYIKKYCKFRKHVTVPIPIEQFPPSASFPPGFPVDYDGRARAYHYTYNKQTLT